MIAATDWTGIATMIGALSAAIVAVVGAFASLKTNRQIDTGNGRTLGESVADARDVAHDTNAKVTTISAADVGNVDVPPPSR